MTQTVKQTTLGIAVVGTFFVLMFALPNFSHAMTNASGTTPVAKPEKQVKLVTKDLSCMQEAVLERETAVMEAWTTFNIGMVAALTSRSEALVAAWKITDAKERAAALKKLWSTWKTDSKKVHEEMKKARKEAVDAFKKTLKDECKVSKTPKEDAGLKDASGAVTI